MFQLLQFFAEEVCERQGPDAVQVLPGCLLLHFAAADLQESQGDVEAARQVYQDLLPSLNPDEPPATPAPQVPSVKPFGVPFSCSFLPRCHCAAFQLQPCLLTFMAGAGSKYDTASAAGAILTVLVNVLTTEGCIRECGLAQANCSMSHAVPSALPSWVGALVSCCRVQQPQQHMQLGVRPGEPL